MTGFHHSAEIFNGILADKTLEFVENDVKINLQVFYDSSKNMHKIIDSFPSSFDLSKAPLLHVKMYILDNEKTLILMDTHHIIVDGVSLNIIIKD